MKTIEIQILARDVNNAGSFLDTNDCILATAIKRQLNVTDVSEGVNHSYINNVRFDHFYFMLLGSNTNFSVWNYI